MRVITGTARGCQLKTLPGEETRPTAQRVKEALFSAIQFEIEGRRVLDLFAGSGQLGIEALSRGAAHCLFVDRQPAAVQQIRDNLKAAQLSSKADVRCADALSVLSGTREWDLVFLDPPYAAGLLLPTLERVAPHITPGGVVICETDALSPPPSFLAPLSLQKTYRYGRIHLWLYRRVLAASPSPDQEASVLETY